LREAVCVQVEKVYDHCREKDCIEDAVVEFLEDVQCLIDKSIKVRATEAKVVKVYTDLDDVPFKRGFFTVNIRYKVKVRVEFTYRDQFGNCVTDSKIGFVWFSKTIILFGSEGQVKIFSSVNPSNNYGPDEDGCGAAVQQDNEPNVKVEVAEPLVLNTQIKRVRHSKVYSVGAAFDEEEDCGCDNVVAGTRIFPARRVVVTIGLFSIIKLTRLVQLLIPAFNFCYPNRECIAATDENPCDLFDTIEFPFDQFFPPQIFDFPVEEEEAECGGKRKRDVAGVRDEREDKRSPR
ncbi:MAG TPA: hypothetical protein VFD00_10830, partial [Thermoclostridium sp.]|nr:hypothetical protein [Thermoclostridium sp.]